MKTWYQKRPDLIGKDEDAAVKEAGSRSLKGTDSYKCSKCGQRKKGHTCAAKARTPSPTSQGKIYACGKCGQPKKGHICSVKETEKLLNRLPASELNGIYTEIDDASELNGIYTEIDDDPFMNVHKLLMDNCCICGADIEEFFMAVNCKVCNSNPVHTGCVGLLLNEYTCSECQ